MSSPPFSSIFPSVALTSPSFEKIPIDFLANFSISSCGTFTCNSASGLFKYIPTISSAKFSSPPTLLWLASLLFAALRRLFSGI